MTLVEVLVALAILGVVLSLTYAAMTSSVRVQASQEAATTTQAKLRRIIEVISQDLRSAVFGSLTDVPYSADAQQVSFMMLAGGAGYPVLKQTNFANQYSFEALITNTASLVGSQVVIVNSNGDGMLLPVSSVSSGATSASRRISSSCRNSIDFADGVLMFQVETTGIRFDSDERNMYIRTAGGVEQPFAFDVSDVRFDYVYTFTTNEGSLSTGPSEPVIVMSTPERGSTGRPVRSFVDANGYRFTLARLQVVVGSIAQSKDSSVEHAYSGQVDLSRAAHFKVEEINTCI